ncbi:hypothetical protein AcV5_004964 [Taiwanofungus camphoratus]|nr:hypothetical protein AcW2_000441 [Antrodia cinnamomea]KAI0936947.1 hypothetical protein AcV5_004964 [Antrodia cinnamomea]KAI0962170.1 hypothetical protein AcV7_001070 [Antrodia cinnamomea]
MRTTSRGRSCYKWLKAMFDKLIQQLSRRQSAAEFMYLRDSTVNGKFAAFEPDSAYGTVDPDDIRPNWEWLAAEGEVRKKAMPTYNQLASVRIDTRVLKRDNSRISNSKRKRPRDDANAEIQNRTWREC